MWYLLFLFFTNTLAQKWVDPHDMNTNHVTEDSNIQINKLDKPTLECNCSSAATDDLAFIYLKRIINLLVSSTTSDDDENVPFLRGKYVFNTEGEDYKFLKKFMMSEKIDPQDLRKLDHVLETAFDKKFTDHILNILVTSTNNFLNFFNVKLLILFATCTALFILCYLLKSSFSFWYIMRYFCFIIWIIDYAFRYQILLEVSGLSFFFNFSNRKIIF